MNAFFYGIYVQWKVDLRNKEILLFYYLVPLIFYLFMGNFFLMIMQGTRETMIVSMSLFGITMGGVLGSGMAICNHYGSVLRKAYQVGGIPFWVYFVQNLLSSFFHLMLMMTILFFSATVIFDATLSISIGMFYLVMALYAIICILISSVLGLLCKHTNKMTMAAQCIFLPSIILSGIMVPIDMLSDGFSIISTILPATWISKWLAGDTLFAFITIIAIVVIFIFILFLLKRMKQKEIVG